MVDMERKISVYVRNNEDGPSCFYRVCQYLDDLNSHEHCVFKIHNAVNRIDFRRNLDRKNGPLKRVIQGILFFKILINRCVSIHKDLVCKPDMIIVQREIFPRYLPFIARKSLERLLKENIIVWDFDDDLLEVKEISISEWELLMKYSNKIIATSNYLLGMVSTSAAKKYALPTTDGFFRKYSFSECFQKRMVEYETVVRLVWVGTAVNLPNVVNTLPFIEQVSNRLLGKKKIELTVVCNIDDESFHRPFDNLSIQFIKWTREKAEMAIIKSHIGLMPLPDTTFSKGKGGFKLIQYMSAGLPVIASAVGMNCEIVAPEMGFLINNDEEWIKALYVLCSDILLWEKYSEESKKRYDNNYSYEEALNVWKKLVR